MITKGKPTLRSQRYQAILWIGIRNEDGHAVTYPLDPTRWWPHAGMLDDKPDETGGRCSCPTCVLNDFKFL